jgi:cytochrome c-type biogenesis protein CcmF
VGPFVRWKSSSLTELLHRLRFIALGALLFAIAAALLFALTPMVVVGVTLAVWIFLATGSHLMERLRHAPSQTPLWQRLSRQPRSYWGMLVAHVGIGVFVIGVTFVKGLDASTDVSMRIGDTAQVGAYSFHFTELNDIKGPNYDAAQGIFEVSSGTHKIATMRPEKRLYRVQRMPMTEAAIERGFTRDLYISLGEETSANVWVVRIQHKPFVGWIWGGSLIIALGGFLAASDRRYRLTKRLQPSVTDDLVNEKPVTLHV